MPNKWMPENLPPLPDSEKKKINDEERDGNKPPAQQPEIRIPVYTPTDDQPPTKPEEERGAWQTDI